MFGLLRSTRARSLVMFFVVVGLFAGGSMASARNRRARNTAPQPTTEPKKIRGTDPVAENPAPIYSGYPAPQTAQERAEMEAAVAEVRRAVGESPVDRVKNLQNPVNSVVPENDYEHPYGLHRYPEGETVIKERGETRIITRRNGQFIETVIGNPPATADDTTVVTNRAERLLNSKNADWLQDAPRNFGGINWCPPPYQFPESSRQLATAVDDGLHDDLECVKQLVGGDALRNQIDKAAYSPPLAERHFDNWNEKPVAGVVSEARFEALPMELRNLARRLDVRAADLEDGRKFDKADHLRELAGMLRREARNLEPEDIFSFNISTAR